MKKKIELGKLAVDFSTRQNFKNEDEALKAAKLLAEFIAFCKGKKVKVE